VEGEKPVGSNKRGWVPSLYTKGKSNLKDKRVFPNVDLKKALPLLEKLGGPLFNPNLPVKTLSRENPSCLNHPLNLIPLNPLSFRPLRTSP